MARTGAHLLVVLAAALAPAVALGDQSRPALGEPYGAAPWQPRLAAHLSGEHGLTGFGSMVDGEHPSPLLAPAWPTGPLGTSSVRFTLRAGASARAREVRGHLGRYDLARERATLSALHGLSVRGFDLALGLPYTVEREAFERAGLPGRVSGRDEGLGAVLVSGKLGLRVPRFMFGEWAVAGVSLYAIGRISTRDDTSDPAEVEAGVAISGPYGYGFRYQANVAVVQREGGVTAALARGGASSVPIAVPGLVLRAFGHLVGLQNEGGRRPSIDLELGVQCLLFDHLTLDLVGSVRLLESGFLEPELVHGLRALGDEPRHQKGEGAWSCSFGLGVVF